MLCDYRYLGVSLSEPVAGGSSEPLQFAQASVSWAPMTQPITESMIVTGCTSNNDSVRSATRSVPSEEPSALCVVPRTTSQGRVKGMPILVFGTSCQAAGYTSVADEIAVINDRRAMEARIEAVPGACPTRAQATAWITSQVTHFRLTLPILTHPDSEANGCFRPFVDWFAPRKNAVDLTKAPWVASLQPPGFGFVQLLSDPG